MENKNIINYNSQSEFIIIEFSVTQVSILVDCRASY